MRDHQSLIKVSVLDLENFQEVVVDEESDAIRWHRLKLSYDQSLDKIVVRLDDNFHYINP